MSLTASIIQLKSSIQNSSSIGILVKSFQNSFFSDREIAKNIIMSRSPGLTMSQANTIVYGQKTKSDSSEENLESNLNDIKKNNQLKYRYLSKDDQIFKEVSDLKTGILNSSFIIGEKSVKLKNDVANLGIMVINALPGVAAYIAVGNIPGAINSLLAILNEVDKVKLHFNDLLPHIEMMNKLGLVVPDDSAPYSTIEDFMTILNGAFTAVNAINLSSITERLNGLKSENTSSGTTATSDNSGNSGSSGTTTTTTKPKIININLFYKDRNNKSFYLDITIVEKNTLQLKWPKPTGPSGISYDYKYYSSDEIKNRLNLGVDIYSLEFIIDDRDSSQRFMKINDLQDKPNILYVLTSLNFTYPNY
jgi:hypothetical protein